MVRWRSYIPSIGRAAKPGTGATEVTQLTRGAAVAFLGPDRAAEAGACFRALLATPGAAAAPPGPGAPAGVPREALVARLIGALGEAAGRTTGSRLAEALDGAGDGSVSLDEWLVAACALTSARVGGLPDHLPALRLLYRMFDVTGAGRLTVKELREMLTCFTLAPRRPRPTRRARAPAPAAGSGSVLARPPPALDVGALLAEYGGLADAMVECVLLRADRDGDGALDFGEFCAYCKSEEDVGNYCRTLADVFLGEERLPGG